VLAAAASVLAIRAGLHRNEISAFAAVLHDPSSPITQNVAGAANYGTGAICKMTNNQPSDVCSSSAVTAVQSNLG